MQRLAPHDMKLLAIAIALVCVAVVAHPWHWPHIALLSTPYDSLAHHKPRLMIVVTPLQGADLRAVIVLLEMVDPSGPDSRLGMRSMKICDDDS